MFMTENLLLCHKGVDHLDRRIAETMKYLNGLQMHWIGRAVMALLEKGAACGGVLSA
jgi:hypothetical protein